MARRKAEYSVKPLIPSSRSGQPATPGDPLAVDDFDHIHLYCESAKQSAFFLQVGFGFQPLAYRGPETGWRESVSYVLTQGAVNVVLSSPLQMTSPISNYVQIHGFSAADVAFRVPDCEAFYYTALQRGAKSASPPTIWEDAEGSIKHAAIKTYGETVHSIVERSGVRSSFWPGYVPFGELFPGSIVTKEAGLKRIDHVVGNVHLGKMDEWVRFYEEVLGFTQLKHFTDDDISTEYSALMSKVMNGGGGKIKLPINEPAEGRRKSQIQEYLEANNGAGVQHIAFQTTDIIGTVSALREKGIRFLTVPKTYYDEVSVRVGTIKEDLKRLTELGVLVDRDEDGYLLQIFTKPLQDRPTLFFEIIQREGSQGFGAGNFKALFEAIERDQKQRGNL